MTTQVKLPPIERDFDIYHAIQITGSTTRRVAELNDLSQTRVRQIVARVVQWIADVLPPEADIAKEKRAHLACHIAADRLQFQLEEASEHWSRTSAPKYMSLLTRITIANARLGVVSGTIDGLCADVLEGLPVGAVLPESPNPESEVVLDAPNPVPLPSFIPNPEIFRIIFSTTQLLDALRHIDSDYYTSRVPLSLDEALEILTPEQYEGLQAYAREHFPMEQLALEAAVYAGQIPSDQDYRIDATSNIPPVGDCSTKYESTDAPIPSTAELPRENHVSTFTCDDDSPSENPQRPAQESLSQPLLNSPHQASVAQLTLTPKHTGAPITVITPHT